KGLGKRNKAPSALLAVRKATPADLDAIDRIEAASFARDRFPRRNLSRLLRQPTATFLLAESEKGALGYLLLLFRRGAKAARLYSLAVLPEARGKGVARGLVRAAVRCAIERRCDRLRLEVRRSNRGAVRLYDDAGFLILEELPGYYDDGETALHMELRLDKPEDRRR
ncbi:MAG TPA: N-acetyltransferase, partial [Parvularculaceae bacterium]|nr:N-acetyltransferase [Parvularculaceae bacterium]